MYINKAVKEHDGIVIIGSVEPHYFAVTQAAANHCCPVLRPIRPSR